MSLLIKGMDMQRCCKVCKFSYYTVGKLMRCLFPNKVEDYVQRFSQDGERDFNCPLAEIPTPHGRLIDADRLYETIEQMEGLGTIDYENDVALSAVEVLTAIDEAPTIIETEE